MGRATSEQLKICLVHNAYGKLSGEEVAVEGLRDSLANHGHTVIPFFRSSAELEGRQLGKVGAFVSGIYNVAAQREFARLLDVEQPDLVHINNLFPLISPSILDETNRRNIPTVMTLHNYRLLCPTGLLFSHGEICHRCLGGREWWCAIRNCTGERPKSFAYGLRNWVARQRGSFDTVSKFVAPSNFVKSVMTQHGYMPERIAVVPYALNWDWTSLRSDVGEYVGFAGRISPEKGVGVIIEAARLNPHISFRFAGHYIQMPEIVRAAPPNCVFLGPIERQRLGDFFAGSRFMIFSSSWYETFGIALLEAMAHGKPVVVSKLGVQAETVENERTGMHFEPGNAQDLSEKIRFLWERPNLCRSFGSQARAKVLRDFSLTAAYKGILAVYSEAVQSQNSAHHCGGSG
ncbi:MAG: glycosyltransferase [Candidatus Binataceae bacterium]